MYSPSTYFNPSFLVSEILTCFIFFIIILLSFFEYSSKIFNELSGDSSLIQIIWILVKDWLIILSKQSLRYFSALYIGIIIEILYLYNWKTQKKNLTK